MTKKRKHKEKNKNQVNKDNNDEINNTINKMEEEINENENGNELFNCVFLFSCILPEYFLMIKNLILPNFILENISLNGLTDLIICMREDIGTTLKVENDDENKIFGVFTLIPLHFYNNNPVVEQVLLMFKSKIQNIDDNNLKIKLMNILNNKRLGLLINERFINLPESLIAPSLSFIIKEMNECIDIANDNKNISKNEKNKYNLDYIIMYSRYVIKDIKDNYNEENEKYIYKYDDNNNINLFIKENNNKKPKIDIKNENFYYKYEMASFLKKADYFFDYNLTGSIYDSSSLYLSKNNNEFQYMKVLFISKPKFYEVILELNKNNI